MMTEAMRELGFRALFYQPWQYELPEPAEPSFLVHYPAYLAHRGNYKKFSKDLVRQDEGTPRNPSWPTPEWKVYKDLGCDEATVAAFEKDSVDVSDLSWAPQPAPVIDPEATPCRPAR